MTADPQSPGTLKSHLPTAAKAPATDALGAELVIENLRRATEEGCPSVVIMDRDGMGK